MIVAGWRRWLGFGFVYCGKSETGEEGREKKIRERRFCFGYIF